MPSATESPTTAVPLHGAASRLAVPAGAREHTTLARVDYEDAFHAVTALATERTAEDWARAILEEAPPATRTALRRGWTLLGLRLGATTDERQVLGWQIRRRSPEAILLAVSSRLGAEAELLCTRDSQGLMVVTFLQLRNPIIRLIWAAAAPKHRRAVPHLINAALRRAGGGRRG